LARSLATCGVRTRLTRSIERTVRATPAWTIPRSSARHRFDAGSHFLRCAYLQVIFVERKCVVPVGVPSEKDT
jgi:hypothetical protein